uniref:Uncharacterized protein n=1 Tax=Cucumis sativus TaxID=3659 RepID=A0A0A0LN23_CUCSA
MVLRRPGRNRNFNRENPDILIMMIAVDQIIRGCEQDKGDGTERKGMGPLKPATKRDLVWGFRSKFLILYRMTEIHQMEAKK